MSNDTDRGIDSLKAYVDDVDDSLIALLAQRRELETVASQGVTN